MDGAPNSGPGKTGAARASRLAACAAGAGARLLDATTLETNINASAATLLEIGDEP